ncbi:MAG: M23 family metallopeptidase [Chloroflexota bacterium]|nr:M23 family metallopeptidase [Chloroflexota bacterium]
MIRARCIPIQTSALRWTTIHLLAAVLTILAAVVVAGPGRPVAVGSPSDDVAFSYPIGDPGRPLGDGFVVRHGYATENTWYLPGYLHTGEDWYRLDGDTAGATVYAIGAGAIVFVGSDYPGRVVIVQHERDLFSMYGHLDPRLAVRTGDRVERGEPIGTVAARRDDVPNHLHFEVRTFLTTSEVNGDAPRYDFNCGVECPPGPGYWPIDAPDHPSDLGWRNPTHLIAAAGGEASGVEVAVASDPPEAALLLRAKPVDGADLVTRVEAEPGRRYALADVSVDLPDTTGSSAEAYAVWYHIETQSGQAGWVRAAVPSEADRGSDGRPSTVRFVLLPAIEGNDPTAEG